MPASAATLLHIGVCGKVPGDFFTSSDMTRLDVTYRFFVPRDQIESAAAALAVEQSIEMPLSAVSDQQIKDQVVGRVEQIEALGEADFRVRVSLNAETTGGEPGQLMNMLFGNSSIHPHVTLEDVAFPAQLLGAFPGPRFGVDGIRAALGVVGRPLTASALKPLGSSPDALAALAGELARGGIDLIKDDHGLADQVFAPFAKRVSAVQRAIEAAGRDTGRRVLYAPSLTGNPRQLRAQAEIIDGEGVGAAMLAPMISGLPAFAECVAEYLHVPVLAHPALAGAARIAPPLLMGKFFRLFGADAVIFPNDGGRFGYSAQTCIALADNARRGLGACRAAFPVPAGGMSVARAEEMIGRYGNDVILLIGGALLSAKDGVTAAAQAFSAQVARFGGGSDE
jgi:ribulose-bisphosphate carboxylase large chain